MPLLETRDYGEPILQVLKGHPEGISGGALVEEVADLAGITTDQRRETLADGTLRYAARIRYARSGLKTEGFVTRRPGRLWALTDAGSEALEMVRARWQTPAEAAGEALALGEGAAGAYATLPKGPAEPTETPVERVDRTLREITEEVEDEVSARLALCPPGFFEQTVLALLEAMGYGRMEHTGGPGDEGIDGVLRADPLGLERVYVQAKRRREDLKVTAAEIQTFVGALAQQRAHKGVMVTTASFTEQAEEGAAAAPEPLALIDGKKLASLMVEHGIGVSRRHVRVIPEVDRDFFEDD